ncbi:MAG: DNA cytosine methyltransferase [Acidimicrobiales bacterium]
MVASAALTVARKSCPGSAPAVEASSASRASRQRSAASDPTPDRATANTASRRLPVPGPLPAPLANYRPTALSAQGRSAADHGVPQLRPRLFVLGAPKRCPLPELPRPTHGGRRERRTTGRGAVLPHVTAGEALDGLASQPEPEEVLRGRWASLLPGIPPGENYLHYTAKRGHPDPVFEWRSRYWSFLLKLDPARPSPTVQAQPGPNVGPFHWENRRLRIPELKRLFTFPDDFELVGRRSSVQAQIGNSVPPALAKSVCGALLG